MKSSPMSLLSLLSVACVVTVQAEDYSCDAINDPCPENQLFDGVCEADTAQCAGGDCFDCDQCRQFDYDCDGCMTHGCYWCPEDSTCFNSPYYVLYDGISTCTHPDHYSQTTCQRPGSVFSDPMYTGQNWVYQQINVEQAWKDGYTGAGVRVRVNDDGIEWAHPEFSGRLDIEGSCDIREPVNQEEDYHGTRVAGIIGAAANNGECSVGIAPAVTMSSCYAFGNDMKFLGEKLHYFDISQNSYGIDGCTEVRGRKLERNLEGENCPFTFLDSAWDHPCDVCDFNDMSFYCERVIANHCYEHYEDDVRGCLDYLDLILGGNCLYQVLSYFELQTISTGILEGRGGKGVIYVWASGNAYHYADDTNFQKFTNSRFIISVGATGKDGSHASYSTPGASLFISAPGGDFEHYSNHISANVNGQCGDIGYGTSFACPVVSGVVALMLEANPSLTWRDVQDILASTAQPVQDEDDDTAATNAAGYWHSNFYGFGMVDAGAAVRAAENWALLEPEKVVTNDSGFINLPIVDDIGQSTVSTISIQSKMGRFKAESVAVLLDLEHFSRGHLEITLTSPHGTKSILHPGDRPENSQLDSDERWKLLTLKSWGESVDGDWTLSIVDDTEGEVEDCVDAPWQIEFDDGSDDFTCATMERVYWCEDGVLDPYNDLSEADYAVIFSHEDEGMKAQEACCSCGGGLQRSDVVDQLRHWRLVIYGQERLLPTDEPTSSPTTATMAPTAAPSSPPTASPTQSPTEDTTKAPTTAPSVSPSSAPTDTPTPAPTPSGANVHMLGLSCAVLVAMCAALLLEM